MGIGYSTRALGVAGKATLVAWTKNRSVYPKTKAADGGGGGGGVRRKRHEEGHEKLIGGRREVAFSRRGRATHRDVDQPPAFGRNLGWCYHVYDKAQDRWTAPDVLRTDPRAARP